MLSIGLILVSFDTDIKVVGFYGGVPRLYRLRVANWFGNRLGYTLRFFSYSGKGTLSVQYRTTVFMRQNTFYSS